MQTRYHVPDGVKDGDTLVVQEVRKDATGMDVTFAVVKMAVYADAVASREFREPAQLFAAGELEKLTGKPFAKGPIVATDPHLAKARAAKMALRAADRAAREARLEWTTVRAAATRNEATIPVAFGAAAGSWQVTAGVATLAMWSAEARFAACVATWRVVLAERESMPVADRWSLAGLDKWARAQEAAKP
jgi:hypothetical protein